MRLARLFIGVAILLCALVPAHGQDYSKFLFNVGGGIGFPLGNLSNFVNDGGNFVIGGGYGFMKHVGVDTEFMWHDLPINDATKAHLQTPGASARQYSWTFNPIVALLRSETDLEFMGLVESVGITVLVRQLRRASVSSAIRIGRGGTAARSAA